MTNRRPRKNARHGAASVEAALVLPVFALLLIGSWFVLRWYVARDDTRMLVRRCALEYAQNGCTDFPPGCAQVLAGSSHGGGAEQARTLRRVAAARDSFGVLDLPLVSDAIDTLFGTATHAHVERRVQQPWGAEARAAGDFVVLCNDQPRDIGAAIKQVFCDRVPAVRCR